MEGLTGLIKKVVSYFLQAVSITNIFISLDKNVKEFRERHNISRPAVITAFVIVIVAIPIAVLACQHFKTTLEGIGTGEEALEGEAAYTRDDNGDYDFIVENKIRLADNEDKTWQDMVEAKIGDKVEFQFEYRNTGSQTQTGVVVRDILPSNLRYVKGTAKLYNSSHPNGMSIDNDDVIFQGGGNIGSYDANANAFIRITAEVVDDNLACGSNTLINWAQVRVGDTVIQDSAEVIVEVPE